MKKIIGAVCIILALIMEFAGFRVGATSESNNIVEPLSGTSVASNEPFTYASYFTQYKDQPVGEGEYHIKANAYLTAI